MRTRFPRLPFRNIYLPVPRPPAHAEWTPWRKPIFFAIPSLPHRSHAPLVYIDGIADGFLMSAAPESGETPSAKEAWPQKLPLTREAGSLPPCGWPVSLRSAESAATHPLWTGS